MLWEMPHLAKNLHGLQDKERGRRKANFNKIEDKCKYCKKWHAPVIASRSWRITSIVTYVHQEFQPYLMHP